jgi:hypothetical protein
MRFNELTAYVEMIFKSPMREKINIMVQGQPGIGKSAAFQKAANNLGVQLIDIRTSMLARTELMGFPMPDKKNKQVEFFKLDLFPTKGEGIILLEEISSAPLAVQTPLYQLIWDRKLWGYEVPKGWMICSTGNRVQDKATAERISTALASRFAHINLDCTLDDFRSFCFTHNVNPIIPAYLAKVPEGLNNFDPKQKTEAFACPRTWEILSNQLNVLVPSMQDIKHALNNSLHRTFLMEACVGTVGEGQGHSLFGFMEIFSKMFDPQIVLDHPDTAPLPEEISQMFALNGALVNMSDFDNVDRIVKYYKRLPKHMADFLDKYMMDVRRKLCGDDQEKKNTFKETVKFWKEWALANKELWMPTA